MSGQPVVSFRDLDAWKVSMHLMVLSYGMCKLLPASERFELSAQIRRAAVSIPANVAEGKGTGTDGRFMYHLRIALGSLPELETLLEAARQLGFFSQEELAATLEHVHRAGQVLHGLLRSIRLQRLGQAGSAVAFVLAVVLLF